MSDYVKTVWNENDPITVSKIQKIEDEAYKITQEYKNFFNLDIGETTTVGHVIDMINIGIPVMFQIQNSKYIIDTYEIYEEEEEYYYTIANLNIFHLPSSTVIAISSEEEEEK